MITPSATPSFNATKGKNVFFNLFDLFSGIVGNIINPDRKKVRGGFGSLFSTT